MAVVIVKQHLYQVFDPEFAGGNYAVPAYRLAFIVEARASRAYLHEIVLHEMRERARRTERLKWR